MPTFAATSFRLSLNAAGFNFAHSCDHRTGKAPSRVFLEGTGSSSEIATVVLQNLAGRQPLRRWTLGTLADAHGFIALLRQDRTPPRSPVTAAANAAGHERSMP